jgi:hypothetical protein
MATESGETPIQRGMVNGDGGEQIETQEGNVYGRSYLAPLPELPQCIKQSIRKYVLARWPYDILIEENNEPPKLMGTGGIQKSERKGFGIGEKVTVIRDSDFHITVGKEWLTSKFPVTFTFHKMTGKWDTKFFQKEWREANLPFYW